MVAGLKNMDLKKKAFKIFQQNIVYIVFLIVFGFFAIILRDRFLSLYNLMNIARQTAMLSIMAIGMTFALSSGEIDLSVDSIIALSAVVTAIAIRDYGVFVGIIFGIGTGLLVGIFNGFIVAKIKIPSFLVTLTTMGIVAALARWVTDLKPIPIAADRYIFFFGAGNVANIPTLFYWTMLVLIVGYIALNRMPIGKKMLATGGNEKAALFSGINTRKMKMYALMISATSAALAGMLYAGRLHGARYNLGEGLVLSVIAATVIGGTSLFGGRGTVIGAFFGALMIGMINNGLILMGLSISQQMFFRGLILLIAISINVRMQARKL